MPKVFFTSYARDDNADDRLKKAIDKLSERVAAKLGMTAAEAPDVVFFDADAIKTGQDWEQRLGDACRTTPILVCLCSPTYLSREYCAKEFEVFRRRVSAAGQAIKDNVAIIPVIWEHGAPRMVLPDAVSRYQWRDNRLPKSYGNEGLSQLARFPSQREKYLKTIEYLAEAIGAARASYSLPEHTEPVKFDELPLWFQNPEKGPYNLRVVVLHAQRTQWKPRLGGTPIGAAVDAVTSSLKMAWEEIQPGPALVKALRQARDERQVALLVIDRADAGKAPWADYLKAVDEAVLECCAVIIGLARPAPSAAPGAVDVAAQIAALLPKSSAVAPFHDWFTTDDAASLRDALTRAATKVRAALVAADPAARVEDAALADAARIAGIPIETRPVVSGPGGGQP